MIINRMFTDEVSARGNGRPGAAAIWTRDVETTEKAQRCCSVAEMAIKLTLETK